MSRAARPVDLRLYGLLDAGVCGGDAARLATAEAAVLLESIERFDLGEGGKQQGLRTVFDRTVAGAIGPDLHGDGGPREVVPHELAFEIGIEILGRVAVGIRISPPAFVMHGNVQGLRRVGRIVAPHADVPKDEPLSQLAISLEPRLLLGRRRGLRAFSGSPPKGEVLAKLLPTVDDRVGKVACLILGEALGP